MPKKRHSPEEIVTKLRQADVMTSQGHVEDVHAAYERVLAHGWPRSSELTLRPWGERDFRVLDPDGYCLRISGTEQDRHAARVEQVARRSEGVMPTVHMIHGYLGAGKTTFARRLEHTLPAVRFTHDE